MLLTAKVDHLGDVRFAVGQHDQLRVGTMRFDFAAVICSGQPAVTFFFLESFFRWQATRFSLEPRLS